MSRISRYWLFLAPYKIGIRVQIDLPLRILIWQFERYGFWSFQRRLYVVFPMNEGSLELLPLERAPIPGYKLWNRLSKIRKVFLCQNNYVSQVNVYWLSYYLFLESETTEVGSSPLFSTKTSPLGSRLFVLAFLFDKKTLASDPLLVLEFSFTNDRFKASITDFERCSWLPCKLLGSGQQNVTWKL